MTTSSSADLRGALSVAVNSTYASFATNEDLFVLKVDSTDWTYELDAFERQNLSAPPVHALSQVKPEHLGFAYAQGLCLHNVSTRKRIKTLAGTGRAITHIAWCSRNPNYVAAATLDGNILIWDSNDSAAPIQRVSRLTQSKIDCVALEEGILAVSYASELVIKPLGKSERPARHIPVGASSIVNLAWHPTLVRRLLTTSEDNVVRAWDFSETLSSYSTESLDIPRNGRIVTNDHLASSKRPVFPIAQIWLTETVATAEWVGEYGCVILLKDIPCAVFYTYGSDWELLHEIWRIGLDENPDAFQVRELQGTTVLTCISRECVHTYPIPAAVVDGVGGFAQQRQSTARLSKASRDPNIAEDELASMKAIPIRTLQSRAGSFAKTSLQLRRRDSPLNRPRSPPARDSSPPVVKPTNQGMTSSLELRPDHEQNEDDSPMPFISPGIPARKASSGALPPIEDSLLLPPLQVGSFESMPSTETHESDSDDETFAGGMQGSGTIMPGGVNVPLPKACGALFASNGVLVTFFPYRARRQPKEAHADAEHDTLLETGGESRVSRLFPTFGNLSASLDSSSDRDSDGDDPSSPRSRAMTSRIATQSSSFHSHRSWKAKLSPSKRDYSPVDGRHTMTVSTYDMSGLIHTGQTMAEAYRIWRNEGEQGADVCLHNAYIAEQANAAEAEAAWRLLASLMDGKIPHEPSDYGLYSGPEALLRGGSQPLESSLASSQIMNVGKSEHALHSLLLWPDHPLGASWVVRRMFDWAEQRDDLQFLAFASAVLVESHSDPPDLRGQDQNDLPTVLGPYGAEYSFGSSQSTTAMPTPHRNPSLPTANSPGNLYGSPARLRYQSQPSSRNPSQPSTPHLDSASSTPPFSFPPFSRQSTRLSAPGSGSASPEHHRGSFSAAARFYAQSITDKFANYGTSPPIRRSGAINSPGTELPPSFPHNQSGSWSKSVSFASSITAHSGARESHLSKSYTDGGAAADEDYDSDKTIDDMSQPQTPRSRNADIAISFKGTEAFGIGAIPSNEAPVHTKRDLLPPDIAIKAVRWRQMYAEHLRCWGLLVQAASLEKISSLSVPSHENPLSTTQAADETGISPHPNINNKKATCSICRCVIERLYQLCPACLHANHIDCLELFVDALCGDSDVGQEGVFECPAGCGCDCANLPFESLDIILPERQASVVDAKTLAKKRSFTDPRRWRARVEGDSW